MSKSAERKTQKKQAADQADEATVAQKKTKGNKTTTPRAAQKTAEPPKPEPPTTATPDDSPAIVVFAFRMTRAERDELHAATGSAKASRFVKAIALAGARGDMKAIQEVVDEIHAPRQ